MKSHLKRIFTPATWQILRKENKYITRPKMGMHPLREGVSLNTFMKEVIGCAKTAKDVMNIMNKREVLVDKKKRKDKKFMVGFMDVVEFPYLKESFRIIFNKQKKIAAITIPEKESNMKLCKVIGKNLVKGKVQLNLNDSRNILTDKKDVKVGDSLMIGLPEQKILQHLKFELGNLVYFTAGKNIGKTAKLKEIKNSKIICESDGEEFETLKEYAFVVGKDKPVIKIKNE